MAIYINTKTRNTIETDLVVSGGDWGLVEPEKKKKTTKKKDEAE